MYLDVFCIKMVQDTRVPDLTGISEEKVSNFFLICFSSGRPKGWKGEGGGNGMEIGDRELVRKWS